MCSPVRETSYSPDASGLSSLTFSIFFFQTKNKNSTLSNKHATTQYRLFQLLHILGLTKA